MVVVVSGSGLVVVVVVMMVGVVSDDGGGDSDCGSVLRTFIAAGSLSNLSRMCSGGRSCL